MSVFRHCMLWHCRIYLVSTCYELLTTDTGHIHRCYRTVHLAVIHTSIMACVTIFTFVECKF